MIFGEGPIIKNIAGDLNKLFLQGSRVGQPINNVEGDAAADQATVQLMADRDPVIRDISTGLGWAGREVTVSGTGALQLVNSLGRPLKSWSVELEPYQEGSGDPSPENVRPIHGTNKLKLFVEESYDPSATPKAIIDVPPLGKNILNIEAGTHNAWSFVNIPNNLKPNTQYTLSINGGTSYYYTLYLGDTVQSTRALSQTITGGQSSTFTTPSDMSAEPLLALAGSVSGAGNESLSNILPQVELGSSSTSYEPYTNTLYDGTLGSDGGESRDVNIVYNGRNMQWSTGFGGFITAQSLVVDYNDPDAVPSLLCDIYPVMSYNQATQAARVMSVIYGGVGYIYNGRIVVRDNTISSLSEFIAQLTGHQIIYSSTPAQFPLTAPTIPTTEGDGSAWVTAEDGIVTNFSATYLQSE